MTSTADAQWLVDYVERGRVVEQALGALFQRALAREVVGEIGSFRRKTASIRYLQRQRWTFPHRIVLFVYASRFDAAFAAQTLDAQQLANACIDGAPVREAFESKSAGLTSALWTLMRAADRGPANMSPR